MSGPNAPPVNRMPVRPPLDAPTKKPLGAERVPMSAPTLPPPSGRVSGGLIAPAPYATREEAAAMPPPAKTLPLSPERQALADAMKAAGMVQVGPTRAENYDIGKQMLARAMAGITAPPPVSNTQRQNYMAGQPGARELSVTYEKDPSVKFDKKGKPLEGKPQKVNQENKGDSPALYAALGIPESQGTSSIQPEINKLIKKAKETPWLLTRAEDRILSSLNEQGGRSIAPADVEARFRGYEKQRQAAEQEAMMEQYGKTAGKREKLQASEQKKAAKEQAKKDKEAELSKAYTGKPVDTAEAKVQSYIEQMGAPLWQGTKNAPTQADVNAGAKPPAPEPVSEPDTTEEEGDE